MLKPLDRVFFTHPRAVNESYLEHFAVAMGFAVRLLGAGLAALVHALIPCLFEKTASTAIRAMHDQISSRANNPHVATEAQQRSA